MTLHSSVGKAEGLFIFHIRRNATQAAARHGRFSSIDQGHTLGLSTLLKHFHAVVADVEGDIGHVQKVIRKILFDHIAFEPTANHKVIHTIMRIDLHDVPQNRFAADLNHRLRFQVRFL